jgi:hypothetical protein
MAQQLIGLPQYLYQGQNARVEELNERILDRIHPNLIPHQTNSLETPQSPCLEPNFSPRGVPTKYSRFPIIERRTTPIVKIQPLPNYQVETQFNPGYRGPVSGFCVDKETILRNIPFALQADIAQSTFIPSTQSDLYKNYIVSRPKAQSADGKAQSADGRAQSDLGEQPYPRLFEEYKFDQRIHPNVANYPEIGGDLFFNATRSQLRGVGGC